MNFAPMQLTRLWVKEMSIESSLDWTPRQGGRGLPCVSFPEVTLQRAEGSSDFRLFLTVQVPAPEERNELKVIALPYKVSVRVAATFAFLPELELDGAAMRRMVALNGLATLYAFARDVIHQATAQAEHGPFLLPVFNITDVGNRLLEQAPLQAGHDNPAVALQSP